jgi:hypothetical protein
VVAIVDRQRPHTQELSRTSRANFEVEVTRRFDRDVSEDADVGAYIALVDGDRLEAARKLAVQCAPSVSGLHSGRWPIRTRYRTWPLRRDWAMVEVYIYLGQQSPAFYAKQITASIVRYGTSLLPHSSAASWL